MDNCSHNGDILKAAVKSFTDDVGFLGYLEDSVTFPLSMIDKITPRPSERIQRILADDGIDAEIIATKKNTFVSVFVNAESTEYLVIEDSFANGHPPFERVGIIFTEAETVDKVEAMKVCTCLNPLHTVLAVFGCLLGYKTIWEEMENAGLKRLIEKIGYGEGLPVVTDPLIINPKAFIDMVINERFPNPFVPDTPQRIACDTSQKIPVRFGVTLKKYAERGMDLDGLTYIPFFIAGYLRYLLGVDDAGKPFEISPDPRLGELQEKLNGIGLGYAGEVREKIAPLLADKTLFGIDLTEYSLGEKVEKYFVEMIQRPGAVAKALEGI
jgi:fructuronate reductase